MKRKNNTDLTLITIVVERKGCESNRIESNLCYGVVLLVVPS